MLLFLGIVTLIVLSLPCSLVASLVGAVTNARMGDFCWGWVSGVTISRNCDALCSTLCLNDMRYELHARLLLV